MEKDGELITGQCVLKKYLGKDKEERKTLLTVFREHNEKCKQLIGIDMSPATVERYERTLKHTVDFIKQVYNRDDFYLDEVNRKFIEDYQFCFKNRKEMLS